MSMQALEPTHPSVQWVLRAIFAGLKWPDYEGDYLLPSSASDNAREFLHLFPVHCVTHGQCVPYLLLPFND
jgi:hypothetical protein